ncbi:hypothetical protein FOIG_08650 [Fusarium odoratissimum NRRL 54006]|uniref:2EXR domain-containing protein n=2 Tax=Fusarium oxysporum species complex TaxID=171631 RepID=X0JTH8_FUSO5|nr:uncharacterized protein FOIG_08650 [Fusarium odoratissimum NRRL 54006]EXL99625.1 hypothetical protein FOIG_08650 [Fusarium odoratissimum NRRL 54006]TXC02328.1 hypothetical protein FocTR4_00015499 [Fusarium oxysporum f. sp. cubense]
MASFRHFPDLPKDLRNIIWDYASRRSNSGVQIFELQGPEPKQDGETFNATTSDARPPKQQLASP